MQLYQPGAPRPCSHHRCSLFRVMSWLFYLLAVICIVMQRHVSILVWDVQLDESREYTQETVDEGFYAHGSYDNTKDICLRLILKTTCLVVQNPSNNTIFEGHPNQQKCRPSQKSCRSPPLGHGRAPRRQNFEGQQIPPRGNTVLDTPSMNTPRHIVPEPVYPGTFLGFLAGGHH